MTRKKLLTEQLRAAVKASDKTRYRLSLETGIDQGALSRFVHRKVGLTLDTAGLLADALGLELQPRRPVRKRKPTKKGR